MYPSSSALFLPPGITTRGVPIRCSLESDARDKVDVDQTTLLSESSAPTQGNIWRNLSYLDVVDVAAESVSTADTDIANVNKAGDKAEEAWRAADGGARRDGTSTAGARRSAASGSSDGGGDEDSGDDLGELHIFGCWSLRKSLKAEALGEGLKD